MPRSGIGLNELLEPSRLLLGLHAFCEPLEGLDARVVERVPASSHFLWLRGITGFLNCSVPSALSGSEVEYCAMTVRPDQSHRSLEVSDAELIGFRVGADTELVNTLSSLLTWTSGHRRTADCQRTKKSDVKMMHGLGSNA